MSTADTETAEVSNDWAKYRLTLHHDRGIVNISLRAPSIASAVRTVMATEKCPERAIKIIKRVSP